MKRKRRDASPSRADRPFTGDVDGAREGWYELAALVHALAPGEHLEPGYYRNPDWTVRDVVVHLGTWLAEAAVQFERIRAGTYDGRELDIDALNATFLAAMADQPWEVAWVQANAGRTMMLEGWYALPSVTEEAAWWIRKSAAEHFAEHLPRLREWVDELLARRATQDG